MAAKKIRQIQESNRQNIMHKRYQYNINQIKKILQHNNLTIAKADKSKAIVIIDKTTMGQKINTFIQENNIIKLNKDPTDAYQKQIQQIMQKCKDLIDKNKSKYMLNIKPTAPKINAYIKSVLWRVAKRLSLYTGGTVPKGLNPGNVHLNNLKAPS